MFDWIIVTVIVVAACFLAFRSLRNTFKGQGGCGGSCACKRNNTTDACAERGVELVDLRAKTE